MIYNNVLTSKTKINISVIINNSIFDLPRSQRCIIDTLLYRRDILQLETCVLYGRINALAHFDKLSNKPVRHYNVDDLNPSDNSLIVECQTVEDNASLSQRTRVRTATFDGGSA